MFRTHYKSNSGKESITHQEILSNNPQACIKYELNVQKGKHRFVHDNINTQNVSHVKVNFHDKCGFIKCYNQSDISVLYRMNVELVPGKALMIHYADELEQMALVSKEQLVQLYEDNQI